MLRSVKPEEHMAYSIFIKARFVPSHDSVMNDEICPAWEGPKGPRIGGSDLRVFRNSYRPRKGMVPR